MSSWNCPSNLSSYQKESPRLERLLLGNDSEPPRRSWCEHPYWHCSPCNTNPEECIRNWLNNSISHQKKCSLFSYSVGISKVNEEICFKKWAYQRFLPRPNICFKFRINGCKRQNARIKFWILSDRQSAKLWWSVVGRQNQTWIPRDALTLLSAAEPLLSP